MTPLLAITFTLLISLVASEVAKHFKYPRVVGQVVAGMFIGLPFFDAIMTGDAMRHIEVLSELGVIFLFLVLGMEIDLQHLKREKKQSLLIGGASVMVPLVIGYFTGKWLGYENLTSLMIGVCLAITSETTNSQLFMEMHLMRKRLARIIFGSALIADLFAILFLAVLIPALGGNVQEIAAIPVKIIGFAAVIWGVTRLMPTFVAHFEKDESNVAEVALMIVFGLLIATLSIEMGLGEMLGAFLAGVIFKASLRHKCTELCGAETAMHQRHLRFFKRNIRVLKLMTLGFVVPFFFINMGLKMELSTVGRSTDVVVLILLVGVLSKFIAAWGVKPWTRFNAAQTAALGVAMNTRGMISLVIAELALVHGILTRELYAALVIMTLFTILMFPIAMRTILKKHPRALDVHTS